MSVTFGFYNSVSGDRMYNASQLSSLFNGLITDGIFMSIGTAMVAQAGTGMNINVGVGRAWFNGTWIDNNAILPVTIPISEVVLDRIDAVVIEVNQSEMVRATTIKVISGTPASEPANPVLINEDLIHQYPLCYITVASGVTEITAANISNEVGKESTPFITGILDRVNISDLLLQWEAEWDIWTAEQSLIFSAWLASLVDALGASAEATLAAHLVNTSNPHEVTAAQIGAASTEDLSTKYDKPLRFADTEVSTLNWNADATYTDYGFRKSVTLLGVVVGMTPDVMFAPVDADSGNYAKVATAYNGGIYLYAKAAPASTISIPTIIIWAGV